MIDTLVYELLNLAFLSASGEDQNLLFKSCKDTHFIDRIQKYEHLQLIERILEFASASTSIPVERYNKRRHIAFV